MNENETLWQPAGQVKKENQASVKPPVSGQTKPVAQRRKLTSKQTAFIKQLIENPKQSATAAAAAVYNAKDRNTAATIAAENMLKPAIVTELVKHTGKAEMVIMEVLEQSRKEMYIAERDRVQWAVNARQTADSLLDRVKGKATQRTESVSTSVNLNLNLADVIDTPQRSVTG